MDKNSRVIFLMQRRFPEFESGAIDAYEKIVDYTQDSSLDRQETLRALANEVSVDLVTFHFVDPSPHLNQIEIISNYLKWNDATPSSKLPGSMRAFRSYFHNIIAFHEYLNRLPDDELDALYDSVFAKFETAEREEAEERDRAAFFSEPRAQADFDHWCGSPYWTPDEAVALSLGKEPRVVSSDSLEHEGDGSPFVREYRRRLGLVRRAIEVSILAERIDPATFVAWTETARLSLPTGLNMIRAAPVDHDAVSRLRAEIEALRTENEALRNRLHKTEISDTRYKSLYKIFIGIAVYDYNFHAPGNTSATKDIQANLEFLKDTHKLELTVGNDKIREWLNIASTALQFQLERPIGTGRPK